MGEVTSWGYSQTVVNSPATVFGFAFGTIIPGVTHLVGMALNALGLTTNGKRSVKTSRGYETIEEA